MPGYHIPPCLPSSWYRAGNQYTRDFCLWIPWNRMYCNIFQICLYLSVGRGSELIFHQISKRYVSCNRLNTHFQDESEFSSFSPPSLHWPSVSSRNPAYQEQRVWWRQGLDRQGKGSFAILIYKTSWLILAASKQAFLLSFLCSAGQAFLVLK